MPVNVSVPKSPGLAFLTVRKMRSVLALGGLITLAGFILLSSLLKALELMIVNIFVGKVPLTLISLLLVEIIVREDIKSREQTPFMTLLPMTLTVTAHLMNMMTILTRPLL